MHRCISPGVGYNQDFINKFAHQNKTKINYIYIDEDLINLKNQFINFIISKSNK